MWFLCFLHNIKIKLCSEDTVKIRDSALGLSGFVSFFCWAYLRGGAYPMRIYTYVLLTYLTKLTFLGLFARGGGGAITDFYGTH